MERASFMTTEIPVALMSRSKPMRHTARTDLLIGPSVAAELRRYEHAS
jgi:hypothetical protein